VKVMKVVRLRLLGQLFRIQQQNPFTELTLHKQDRTRRIGRPAVRRLESVEGDLKKMAVRNWRENHRIGTNCEQL
jgi:hypothetical protein